MPIDLRIGAPAQATVRALLRRRLSVCPGARLHLPPMFDAQTFAFLTRARRAHLRLVVRDFLGRHH